MRDRAPYNESELSYNERMSSVMTVSRNGQVSIPAEVRARWNASKVEVIDMGGYVVVAPVLDDPVGALRGAYAGPGPSADDMRAADRRSDARMEQRRR